MTKLKKDGTPDKRVGARTAKASTITKKAAPAKKAPAKRAPRAKAEAPVAEPATEPTEFVTFLGREIEVRLPTAEQLVAWNSTLTKISGMDESNATMEEAMKAIGRVVRVLDSVVVKDVDKEWLEDGRIDGIVTVENSSQIVIDAIEKFKLSAPTNRAARRVKA